MQGERVTVEEYFTSLSRRQTMLLLTSLAYGSSEAVAAYEHLPVEEGELLRHRAQALLQIPRERRIPVLVQEIKRLVTQRRRQLGSADPRQLAEVLQGERPAMVEVVLKALPVEVAEAVRAHLGHPAPARLGREVRPEVLSILRWRLEELLRRSTAQVGTLRFTDLLQLQEREVLAVADRMGARVLATAMAGLGEADRAAFLARLPPDQRSLATRAAEAGHSRRLGERDARVVLEMHGALEDPSRGLRSAGVQRVARACIAQSPEFAQRLVERHPGDLGRLLQRWVREERQRPVKGDGGRLDIVEQLERLAQKNILERPARPPLLPRGPAPLRSRPSPGPFRPPAAPASPSAEAPAWSSGPSPAPTAVPWPGASGVSGSPPWSASPAPFRAPSSPPSASASLDRLAAELAEELAVPLRERRAQAAREPARAREGGTLPPRTAPPVPSPPRARPVAAQELPPPQHRSAPTADGGADEPTPVPAPLPRDAGAPERAPGEDTTAPRQLPQVSAQAPGRPAFPSYPGGPPRSRDAARAQVLRDGKPLTEPGAAPPDVTPVPGTTGRNERHRPHGTGRSPVVKGPGRG